MASWIEDASLRPDRTLDQGGLIAGSRTSTALDPQPGGVELAAAVGQPIARATSRS